MKKIIIVIFLFLGIKGFSQTEYNIHDTISKYYRSIPSNNDDIMYININYGENDILSAGARLEVYKIVYDFALGCDNYNNINIFRLGIGKKITKDFVIGVDYQLTIYDYDYGKNVYSKHNFGMFLNYTIFDYIGINYTSNSLTGNSVGLSFTINTHK